MSRTLIELACATGIAPSAWAAEGERAIVTAIEVLKPKKQNTDDGDDEPQMSG